MKTNRLYLIEILHQTTTRSQSPGLQLLLYLIEILHQTTTELPSSKIRTSCILSKFYIKPQHFDFERRINYVVSYRNSTSNHNSALSVSLLVALYLIEILHQTTTGGIEVEPFNSCILSKFYIKPQRIPRLCGELPVVSYRNSTSNHNRLLPIFLLPMVVSYRNSTSNHNPIGDHSTAPSVVSYRNSTSNHNTLRPITFLIELYLIEILHQTTTFTATVHKEYGLYLIEILHQTTTCRVFGA